MLRAMKLNRIALLLILVCFVFTFATFAMINNSSLISEAETEFVITSELKIIHITDTHYYPLRYTYPLSDENGVALETEFYKEMKADTKILLESSTVFQALLEQIFLAAADGLDYVVVSGDLSKDGERASHMDVANAFRKLQNDIREHYNRPNFQVFTVVGNHDMYNEKCYSYGVNGEKKDVSTVSRKDISIIYAGLGYPDITFEEANNMGYYIASDFDFDWETLPYAIDESPFIYSTNAINLNFVWQYIDNGNINNSDYAIGEISYIATRSDDEYSFVVLDVQDSNEIDNHVLTATLTNGTKEFMVANQPDTDSTMFALLHHNTINQYDTHETFFNGFLLNDWVHNADFLADYGIRYSFTGHKHVNSVAHHISFNNNQITDIETAGAVSYKGGFRILSLEKGNYGDYKAEKMHSFNYVIEEVDFTYLIDNYYITDDYLASNHLHQFMDEKLCKDFSEYAKNRIYQNVIDNYMIKFLSPHIVLELSEMAASYVPDSIKVGPLTIQLSSIKSSLKQLIDNLVVEIETKVLADYQYQGSNPLFANNQHKLLAYLEELVNNFRALSVADDGLSVFDLFLTCFYANIAGEQYSDYESLPDNVKQGIQNLKNGSAIQAVLDIVLDKNTGIYRIIEGLLTQELDLTNNIPKNQINLINSAVKGLTGLTTFDMSKAHVDELIVAALAFLNFEAIDLGDGSVIDFLDHTIESYITTSLTKGLGDIVANILLSYAVSSNFNASYDEFVLLRMNANDMFTYISQPRQDNPTVANGKLPSMITVSFGEDTATTKNFVWFTDKRVDTSDIVYSLNEDLSNPVRVSGVSQIYAHTFPHIDLGIFATYGIREIGRHSVELTGLQPNTTYYYRLGSYELSYWSPVYTMRTAPSGNSPFEALLIADPQGYTQSNYNEVFQVLNNVNKVFKNGYDFVIGVGDDVDNSKNMFHYRYLLNTNPSFWANTTYISTTGNHEDSAFIVPENYIPSSNDVFVGPYNNQAMYYNPSIPEQDDLTGRYYSFDYSGVHFTVLNTNDIVDNKLSDAQYQWLVNDLQNTQKVHKVVIMHKGLYSSGSHSFDKDVIGLREQLTPVFSDNSVNLVLSGHDHTYSVTYYLGRDGKPIKTNANGKTKIGEEGTMYVTLGTIGTKFYNWKDNEDVPSYYGKELHNPTLSNPVFAKLVYDGKNLYYEAYQYDLTTGKITELKPKTFTFAMAVILAGAVMVSAGGGGVAVYYFKKKKVA